LRGCGFSANENQADDEENFRHGRILSSRPSGKGIRFGTFEHAGTTAASYFTDAL